MELTKFKKTTTNKNCKHKIANAKIFCLKLLHQGTRQDIFKDCCFKQISSISPVFYMMNSDSVSAVCETICSLLWLLTLYSSLLVPHIHHLLNRPPRPQLHNPLNSLHTAYKTMYWCRHGSHVKVQCNVMWYKVKLLMIDNYII